MRKALSDMSYHNNTTYSVQLELSSLDYLHFTLLLLMFLACLFGNILVISAISVTRKLRVAAFILIINLSVCDLLTAVCGIPFTLIVYNLFYRSQYYPYGEFGCKTLWSFTTYAKTSSVLTLATIAVERYVNTASINIKLTQRTSYIVIAINHLVAFLVTIPYSVYLQYKVTPSGVFCYEVWSVPWHMEAYTIILFIIQYALPLCIMIIFYLSTWRKIYVRNKSVIEMSEDYESKMEWQEDSHKTSITETICSTLSRKMSKEIVKGNSSFMETTSSTIAKKSSFSIMRSQSWDITNRRCKRERTPAMRRASDGSCLKKRKTEESNKEIIPYRRTLLANKNQPSSQNSLQVPSVQETPVRRKQQYSIPNSVSISESLCSTDSIRDRKRFNKSGYRSQIAYMRHRQSIKTLRMFTVVVLVFACFSLPNQVYQWCLIDFPYLSHNVAHIFILLSYVSSIVNCWIYGSYHSCIRRAYLRLILCSCFKKKKKFKKQESFLSVPTSPSLYPQRQEQMFRERKTSFDLMFQEHNRNFDRIKHLYRVSNVEEESEDVDDEFRSFIDET